MAYKITDIQVRRVLECLKSYNRLSALEVTAEYNRRYPPSMIRKIIGLKTEARNVIRVLSFLIDNGLVEKQLFRFTDRVQITGQHMYALTQAGVCYISKKH